MEAQRRHTSSVVKPIPKCDTDAQDNCGSGSFVGKLYRMVDTEPSSIVAWIRGGTAFCIVDPKMMAEHCLPKYFRHRRFSSLIRQLNFYSFYRVQEGQLTIYQHSYFRKGRPDLLIHIKRRAAGKAKDPWFDPLASSRTTESGALTLNAALLNTSGSSIGVCYSPLAKPLAADNMSPLLKPGMAPVLSSSVDLCRSIVSVDGQMGEKRWDNGKDTGYVFASDAQLKQELTTHEHSPTKSSSTYSDPLDIEIEDFLREDCDFSLGFDGKSDENLTSQSLADAEDTIAKNSPGTSPWEFVSPLPTSNPSASLARSDTFEDELLLDLATVEPGTWEVPLSPLNEEEDMMPWLDLCFK